MAALRSPTHRALVRAARRLRVPGVSTLALNFRKPLTGKELGIIAVLANPQLRALRAQAQVAHAQVFAAGLLPDPVVQFSALQPYGLGASGHTTSLADGFLWDLSRLVTRSTDIHLAKERARSIHYQIAWREWVAANRVRLTARRVYWLHQEWQIAQDAQGFWSRNDRLLARDTRRHLIAGSKTLVWEAVWDSLRLQTASLKRAYDDARFSLNRQLGLPPRARLSIARPKATVLPTLTAARLFRRAAHRRLDLVALVASYHSANSALMRAVLDQYPRLSLGFAGARNSSGVTEAGFQLSLVVPLFNRGRGAVALAKARRGVLFQDYVARLARARAQIYRLKATAFSLNRELKSLHGRSQTLGRFTRAAQGSYKAHALGLFPYLTLMQELLTVRLHITALRLARATAAIALQTATGTPWSGAQS